MRGMFCLPVAINLQDISSICTHCHEELFSEHGVHLKTSSLEMSAQDFAFFKCQERTAQKAHPAGGVMKDIHMTCVRRWLRGVRRCSSGRVARACTASVVERSAQVEVGVALGFGEAAAQR